MQWQSTWQGRRERQLEKQEGERILFPSTRTVLQGINWELNNMEWIFSAIFLNQNSPSPHLKLLILSGIVGEEPGL